VSSLPDLIYEGQLLSGENSIAISPIEKDMVFPPFGKMYF